jgi:hypothetical protein
MRLPLPSYVSVNHLDFANPFILDFTNFKVQDLPEDHTPTFAPTSSTPESVVASS